MSSLGQKPSYSSQETHLDPAFGIKHHTIDVQRPPLAVGVLTCWVDPALNIPTTARHQGYIPCFSPRGGIPAKRGLHWIRQVPS